MATQVRKTAAARPSARDHASEINAAVLQLLKAIPVDHLDRRLSAAEKWLTRLQKDVARLMHDVGGATPAQGHHVATAKRAATPRRSVPRARRAVPVGPVGVSHLPVERELAHPGG